MRLQLAAIALTLIGLAPAHADEPWQNWFNDPYFQVRDGIPACPTPAGPLTDARTMRAQAHYRAERGTSCWLAGTCERPNAYAYDQDIAQGVREAFNTAAAFADSSLWITVQRRFVFVEGCAGPNTDASALEALLKKVKDVEHVITALRTDPDAPPPYLLLPTPDHPQP